MSRNLAAPEPYELADACRQQTVALAATCAEAAVLDLHLLTHDHPLVTFVRDDRRLAASTRSKWWVRGVTELLTGGDVLLVEFDPRGVTAAVRSAVGDGSYVAAISADGTGTVSASCTCPVGDKHRVLWCKHRAAVALVVRHLHDPHRPVRMDAAWFSDDRIAADVPVPWTFTTLGGTVRHLRTPKKDLPAAQHSLTVLRCGRTSAQSTLVPAITDLPLCRPCAAAYEAA